MTPLEFERAHGPKWHAAPELFAAVRRALGRHRNHMGICHECSNTRTISWPCNTVREITAALSGN